MQMSPCILMASYLGQESPFASICQQLGLEVSETSLRMQWTAGLKLAGLALFKLVLRATAARCRRPMAGTCTGDIPKILLTPVASLTCVALRCTCSTLHHRSALVDFLVAGGTVTLMVRQRRGTGTASASTSACLGGRRRRRGAPGRGHGGPSGGACRGGRRVRGHRGRSGSGRGSGSSVSGRRGGQPSSLRLQKGWAETEAIGSQRCCRLSFLAKIRSNSTQRLFVNLNIFLRSSSSAFAKAATCD